jgi:glycine/D-amino acid oxidase-like deaminating enzyme
MLNRAADSGVRMVPRAEQRREIDTDVYYGGMIVERSGGVHPALYFKGLADAARRAGARLVDRAAVEAIDRDGAQFALRTSRGRLSARQVIVATNGYTGPATPWHQRRVIPVASFIIATEEIGEARVRQLFPTMRMIAETRRVLNYYRPSPDGRRVIFGGRARFRPTTPRQAAPILFDRMRRIFPSLDGVRLTHAWSGNVAFTFDGLPHMGAHDGIHYCLGCNGSGVVMMSYLGWQTALKILGRTNRPCAFEEHRFDTRPFYDGRPWFLPLVGTYLRARDALDIGLARLSKS